MLGEFVNSSNNNNFINISSTDRDTSIQTVIKQKSSLVLNQQQRNKNLLTFNLNNQIIQKNILKLQKTNNTNKNNNNNNSKIIIP